MNGRLNFGSASGPVSSGQMKPLATATAHVRSGGGVAAEMDREDERVVCHWRRSVPALVAQALAIP